MTQSPSEIAEQLSEVVRDAVLGIFPDEWFRASMIAQFAGFPPKGTWVWTDLKQSGLFQSRMSKNCALEYSLNPLGLAVRKHLENSNEG